MKKWRVGIIGVGGIFNGAHREHYLKDDRLEVVALCDISRRGRSSAATDSSPTRRYIPISTSCSRMRR